MKFFYNMERRFRNYAIPNLMYYIIGMYGAGLLLGLFVPEFYIQYLSLDAQKILSGQIWRIVTFMIYPPGGGSLFGSLIGMYLYYMLGGSLERVWVAFAATFPDLEFLLFFVIPIKAKWMAMFNGIYFLYEFLMGNMATRITILMSLINFFVFFLLTRNLSRFNPKEIKRKQSFHRQMKMMPQGGTHHKCAVCGRTEKDSPNLEFRYCSKCEGSMEYCSEHLYTHKHVTSDNPTTGDTTN